MENKDSFETFHNRLIHFERKYNGFVNENFQDEEEDDVDIKRELKNLRKTIRHWRNLNQSIRHSFQILQTEADGNDVVQGDESHLENKEEFEVEIKLLEFEDELTSEYSEGTSEEEEKENEENDGGLNTKRSRILRNTAQQCSVQ